MSAIGYIRKMTYLVRQMH